MSTYYIIRYYADDRPSKFIKRVHSEFAVQDHCKRENTHGADWFDGYTDECPEHLIRDVIETG